MGLPTTQIRTCPMDIRLQTTVNVTISTSKSLERNVGEVALDWQNRVFVCRCGTCVVKHGRPVYWVRMTDCWESEFKEKAAA